MHNKLKPTLPSSRGCLALNECTDYLMLNKGNKRWPQFSIMWVQFWIHTCWVRFCYVMEGMMMKWEEWNVVLWPPAAHVQASASIYACFLLHCEHILQVQKNKHCWDISHQCSIITWKQPWFILGAQMHHWMQCKYYVQEPNARYTVSMSRCRIMYTSSRCPHGASAWSLGHWGPQSVCD